MKILNFLLIVFLLAPSSLEETVNFDPYEVLGVERSATNEEIRKVYKKLVVKWHPDKNKSPDAQDIFIKIQQAYEILSNEDKREQYDTGGYSGDTVGQWHHQSRGFDFSDFGQDFFNTRGSGRTISVHEYYTQVLPASHLTPHLIYVYSTFCAQCVIWLRTTWQRAASDLESLGVSICTVDTTFASRVAARMGVTRVPTIVGLYKERVYFFKGQINREELKFFVKSFLPTDIISTVTSASANEFLSGIEVDDKPRSILFSDKSEPTLLYTLMAIRYQHYLKFGFVNLRDKKAAEFMKQFGISNNGPTLLVFKEDLTEPAVVLGSSEMPKGAINEILAANKFVTLPRLTSQNVYDELCPSPHGAVHSVRLCMVLLSDPTYADYKVVSGTLKKLVASAQGREENLSEWLEFMQVHVSKQPAFARSLQKPFFKEEKKETQLFLLWRRGHTSASLLRKEADFLQETFPVAEQQFQLYLRSALEAAHLQRFQATVSLAPLVDELAPFFIIWVLKTAVYVIESLYHFIMNMTEKGFMSTIMTFLFFVFLFRFVYSRDEEETNERGERRERANDTQSQGNRTHGSGTSDIPAGKENIRRRTGAEASHRAGDNSASPKRRVTVDPQELLPSSYDSLVLSQIRGHMTVVLLVDHDTAEGRNVMLEYQEAMKVHARDPRISVTYLNIQKYSAWYLEIRRASSAEPPDAGDAVSEESSLHGSEFDSPPLRVQSEQTIAQATGTVLALNGARHWYCMFVPRDIKWGGNKTSQGNENGAASSGPGNEKAEETYEEALSCWMDRVREGQMPRLYVRQWPGLYLHSPGSHDDEED